MFPGHKICQLINNNHRLRSGVARGECDNTLERALQYRSRSSVLVRPACDMHSFAPCLHEEEDTRIFARATEAAKRPNKKINSCAVHTDVVFLAYLWCNSCKLIYCGFWQKSPAIVGVKSYYLAFFIHSQVQ